MNPQIFTGPATGLVTRAWRNKHTTIAAAVYVGAKVGARLGAVWFPSHTLQFQQTADILESAGVGYGLVMAGDSGATTTKPTP